jgi:pyruvate,water dikinase
VDVPAGYWTRETSHAPLPWRPFTEALTDTVNAALLRQSDELAFLFEGAQFRMIGGWEYIGIVPLRGGEPALRRRIRQSVAAMRADVPGQLLRLWSQEWRPDFTARIQVLRERRLLHCLIQPWTPT